MIRSLLNAAIGAFAKRYDYDVGWWRRAVPPSAGARLFGLSVVSGYRGGAPEIWAGALLASTLDGECGPSRNWWWRWRGSNGLIRRSSAPPLSAGFRLRGRWPRISLR